MTSRGRCLALLLLSTALAVLDVPLLMLSVGFGPEGFGGDANPPASQVAAYHRAQWAGVTALLLAFVSLTVFLLGPRLRQRELLLVLTFLVQLLAFVWFWTGAVA